MSGKEPMEEIKKEKKNRKEIKPSRKSLKSQKAQELAEKTNRDAGRFLQAFEDGGVERDEQPEGSSSKKRQPLTQKTICKGLPLAVTRQVVDFKMDYGPFELAFSPNGRFLACGANKGGSLGVIDTLTMDLSCDINVKDRIRAMSFYHNDAMLAVAQEKYTYIYDNQGTELHCLRDLNYTYAVDFLPHHFLLLRIGQTGELKYLDVSTGEVVATCQTKKGACEVMKHNPENAIVFCGHDRGDVTLWSPNSETEVGQMKAHRSRVKDLSLSLDGRRLATVGYDGEFKVWDTRKLDGDPFLREKVSASSTSKVSFSQRGLLAVTTQEMVNVWDPTTSECLYHYSLGSPSNYVESMCFRPFEDILFLGHVGGVRSIVTPGASVANYDSLGLNPFETAKEKREKEIHQLLEKVPPSTIALSHKAGFVR